MSRDGESTAKDKGSGSCASSPSLQVCISLIARRPSGDSVPSLVAHLLYGEGFIYVVLQAAILLIPLKTLSQALGPSTFSNNDIVVVCLLAVAVVFYSLSLPEAPLASAPTSTRQWHTVLCFKPSYYSPLQGHPGLRLKTLAPWVIAYHQYERTDRKLNTPKGLQYHRAVRVQPRNL